MKRKGQICDRHISENRRKAGYKMFELISSHIHVILGAFTGWIISKGVRSEEPQLIIYGIL